MKLSKNLKLLKNYLLYQKYYRKTKILLSSNYFDTKEKIEEYQYNRLKSIIEYAYKNIPYYHELFEEIEFHPDQFKTIKDLKKIPYLTKEIVRENQDKILSQTFNKTNIKVAETGGTTGLPMTFYLDKRISSLIEMAYLEHIWGKINYKKYDKCIILREDEVEKIVSGEKYWKMSYLTNWLTMSGFHLNADTFPLYYKKIMSFKPRFIMAFPSNAYLLAKFIKDNKLPRIPSLKGIICSSENIFDWQRQLMEEIYQAKILSYYGHSEKCIIASECTNESAYIFYPQYGFVELINHNDEDCTIENEQGEIVATGFNNLAAPFIRYKTEDIGINTNKHCEDNPYWFTIKKIEGRKQDFIVDKDGTPKTSIHIDRPFWNIRDIIYAYQYIQNDPGKLLLHVQAKNSLSQTQIDGIKRSFFNVYFKFELEVKEVDYIPRTRTGKFKYLVQNIKIT